jgi:galactokinase
VRGLPPARQDGPGAWMGVLEAGGLAAGAAERVARGLTEASACLHARTGSAPEFAFFVPGRIEVLGKHTDYAGGRSLLAAMEWGFGFVGHRYPGGDGLRVFDAEGARALHLPFQVPPRDAAGGWAQYPATVVGRVAQDFPDVAGGVSIAFASDLPRASGMSSSSALVVGTFVALAAGLELAAGLPADFGARERLAAYLAAVESGVGTDGGSEDHTAILAARAGGVAQYSFLPTRFEGATPLPPDWTFAVASSGVHAEKAERAQGVYNRLAEEARVVARIWREETGGTEPHLGAILAASPAAASRLAHILRRGGHSRLLPRLHQFATESTELVPAAAAALAAGDLDALGDLVARSQGLAEEVLGNQIPETSHLVTSARQLGAPAASAFGAGFGGAVWALVPAGDVTRFLAAWRTDYVRRFPDREGGCVFLATGAGPATFRVL